MSYKYTHTDIVQILDVNNELLLQLSHHERLYPKFGYEMISILSDDKNSNVSTVLLLNQSPDECFMWLLGFNTALLTIIDEKSLN